MSAIKGVDCTQKKEIRVLLSGVEPSVLDLLIASSDYLQLSYRRLMGAKAIKLGSWDKHPAMVHVYFKPGE